MAPTSPRTQPEEGPDPATSPQPAFWRLDPSMGLLKRILRPGRALQASGAPLGAVSARVLAGVFLVSAALVVGALLAERQQREIVVDDIETASGNLARSLVQHAEDTFDMADIALVGIVAQLERDGLDAHGLTHLDDLVSTYAATIPRARSLSIHATDGRTLASSVPTPTGGSNSDAALFAAHPVSRDRSPRLGPPIQDPADGNWVIPFSRRFENADGSFAGIVLATIDVSYFSNFYASLDLGTDGSVSMMDRQGVILARAPFVLEHVGRDMSGTALFTAQLAKARTGPYRITSPLDGRAKIAAYRSAGRYPLLILVAVGEKEALTHWRSHAYVRMGAVSALTLVIWAMGLLFVGKLRRLRMVQEGIAASEASFRALAENAGDMVTRIGPDRVLRYVSPACATLLGVEASHLLGKPALERLQSGDMETFQAALGEIASRASEAVTLTHRAPRRDGKTIWLETTVRAARDPRTGEPDGFVAVSRDITERHEREESLAVLAATDGLTELANRRAFDAALAGAWTDAKRSGGELSLVLIDVDRFKLFNDTYGHEAGDVVLRKVAAALADVVCRPDDLAARYGGEEFALVLPGADKPAAAAIADRARAAVQALAIPHGPNQPTHVVTVSCGVASFERGMPFRGEDPVTLLRVADKALYEAKRTGRNRVCGPYRPMHAAA